MTIKYKGQEIRILPPIKRYVNAISRKLNLPFKIKSRVMCDLTTSICARHEAGESYDEIMKSLGTPFAVAADLNEQMSEYSFRKSPWRFVMLFIAVLSVLFLIIYISLFYSAGHIVGVIGGADGPTSIYVASNAVNPSVGSVIACCAILLISIFGFFKLSRLNKK